MKLVLAALILAPTVSFAATRTLCERQVARSQAANANAEAFDAEYATAQQTYERELQQNKSSVSADQAALLVAMREEIAAEFAQLDLNLRAQSEKMTDVNGNLSPVYLRLRQETQARIDAIEARYAQMLGEVAGSYSAAAYSKVSAAYEASLAAHLEAKYAYESAVEACK